MVSGAQWRGVSLVVLLGVLVAPVWCAWGKPGGRLWLEAQQRHVRQERSSLSRVAQAALPAVVSITTRQTSAASDESEDSERKGIGSGVIIHPEGYILTSAHVVEGAEEIAISLLSEHGFPESYTAEVVGEDERTDFALLKIDAPRKLPVLPLSSAANVEIGDWIVVIGNPFGLAHSVTVGVVSAKGRTDVTPNGREGDYDYMQVDASINPGNSGGPVLNLRGEVVAIANAVNVSGQGIGFAIPIDIAKAVLPHLRKHGRVRRGWLGISVEDCTPEVAAAYGLPEAQGVVISDVREDSPAARAGLRVGDVIVGLGSTRVERAHKLRWLVAARGVGRFLVLRVRRGERPLKVRVRLKELPEEVARPAPVVSRPSSKAPRLEAEESAPSAPATSPRGPGKKEPGR